MIRRTICLLASLALATASCAGLRDRDPFLTDTVTLSIDEVTGEIVVEPAVIYGDWSYGSVQVNNLTGENHGFAIDELALYVEVARDTAPIIGISDARDDTTYLFYCGIHDPKGQQGTEYRGQLVIDYRTEEKV